MKNRVWTASVIAMVTAMVNAGDMQKSTLSYEEELSIRQEAERRVNELNRLSPHVCELHQLAALQDKVAELQEKNPNSPKLKVFKKELSELLQPSPLSLSQHIVSPKLRPVAVRTIATH